MLTLERLKFLLSYNPETGMFTWLNKSSPKSRVKIGGFAGALSSSGTLTIRIDNENFRLDQLAVFYMTGALHKYIEHIDGIVSNNRFKNLFVTTKKKRKEVIMKRIAEGEALSRWR